jgi:general stress protein YciG
MAENHTTPPQMPSSKPGSQPDETRSAETAAGETTSAPPRAARGFAAMDPVRQREIARKGGRAVPDEKRSFSQNRELAATAGRKGGQESGGNFANDRARAAAAGRKGGQH